MTTATGTGTPTPVVAGALADSTDLAALGYPAAADDYLLRASVRVKAYTRQDISYGSDTVDLRFPFLLPQRPVTSVTSVSVVSGDGTADALTEYTDWRLEGQKIVTDAYKDQLLRVVYTHGYTTIPDEIRDVVCSVATRMASAPAGLVAGIQSESADGESIGYGSDAFAGVAELTSSEKRVLDRLFPHGRSVPSVAVTL